MVEAPTVVPEVADEDIAWISGLMRLRDLDQPRREFLRARTSIDVSACPGSGKTTLIVAKLAIMARKWPHSTRGICVLSHTNAAREEIQRQLRDTVVGQQLLAYPHFIDTIHGFVNRFLALPWLDSNCFPSVTVDDNVTSAYRRRGLTQLEFRMVEGFLRRKYSGFDRVRLKDRNFSVGLRDREFPAQPSANTYQIAQRAVEDSSRAGYFCYDEMFIWAKALLEDCPAVSSFLQRRFPLVIIDEVQDTSELQVGILNAVFPRSCSEVILQRVGDPNQAIYDDETADSGDSGAFPDSAICLAIPNSFRFGPSIASLASPLAVEAVGADGLQGVGPGFAGEVVPQCSHAVIIFPDSASERVLDVFGEHVLAVFGDEYLDFGVVAAVGGVHREASDVTAGHAKFPNTVPHYWRGYSPEITRRDSHPRTLIGYVRIAQAVVRDGCDLSPGVETIAAGLVRYARRVGSADLLGRLAPRHRVLTKTLSPHPQATAAYRRLLRGFLIDSEALTPEHWHARLGDIHLVAMGLSTEGVASDSEDSFLKWDEQDLSLAESDGLSASDAGPNVYRFVNGTGRSVDIRLGSVHSVKGQTHLATLLLSTYFHDHSAKKILPWLLGSKVNGNGVGPRDQARLRQTYVAMTRPSHLLCLAIPRSVLGDDVETVAQVAALKTGGWAVAEVVDDAVRWCT